MIYLNSNTFQQTQALEIWKQAKLHSHVPLELLGLHSGINQSAHASCIKKSLD